MTTPDPVAQTPISTPPVPSARCVLPLSDFQAMAGSAQALPGSPVDLGNGDAGAPPEAVRAFLESQGVSYSFRVISHINLRGGIGKTTGTISLATRAAQYGFKTCVLDIDSQGSATLAFNILPEDDDPVFYDVWQNPDGLAIPSLRKIDDFLYVLPSSLQNGLLDSSLAGPASQKNAVRGVCDRLRAGGFDLVVVDCPPSLGAAVISTICASDDVVIPTGADRFSFKGVEITIREIRSICDTFSLNAPRVKILYSRYDRRERNSIDGLARLQQTYPESILPTVIRTSTEFNKALDTRATIFTVSGKNKAKEDYDSYVRHILNIPSASTPAAEVRDSARWYDRPDGSASHGPSRSDDVEANG